MSKDMLNQSCCKRIYGSSRAEVFNPHQCRLKAVVEKDGKFYCKRHDPINVEKRRKELGEKWDKRWAAESALRVRRHLEQEYCKKLSNEELRSGIKGCR